mgnify:CR=1 FL=1
MLSEFLPLCVMVALALGLATGLKVTALPYVGLLGLAWFLRLDAG